MEFSEKDAADVAKLKQVMFDKAADGDALAATAFASLLNAETKRGQIVEANTKWAKEVTERVLNPSPERRAEFENLGKALDRPNSWEARTEPAPESQSVSR